MALLNVALLLCALATLASAKCPSYVSANSIHMKHNLSATLGSGRSAVFLVAGTTSKPIQPGAVARVSLEIYGIKILEEDFDICKQLACPIRPGANFQYTFSRALPVDVPQGVPIDIPVEIMQNGEMLGKLRGERV